MPLDPRVILIIAAGAALWWAGTEAVDGVKKIDHKIVEIFGRHKHTPKQ